MSVRLLMSWSLLARIFLPNIYRIKNEIILPLLQPRAFKRLVADMDRHYCGVYNNGRWVCVLHQPL